MIREHLINKIKERAIFLRGNSNFAFLLNNIDFYGKKINRVNLDGIYLEDEIVPVDEFLLSNRKILSIFSELKKMECLN